MSEENKQVEVKPVEPIAKVVDEVEPKPNDDEMVAIATFRSMEKTMVKRRDEAKALKEELAAYKAKESEAEQKLLEEQGKHKEIAEMYKSKLDEREKELSAIQERKQEALKKKMVLDVLKERDLDLAGESAWKLLDTSKLSLNEGSIDPIAVQSLIDNAQKEHNYIFKSTKVSGTVPNTAHTTKPKSLTKEELRAKVIQGIL